MIFEVLGAAFLVMLASLSGAVFAYKATEHFLEVRMSFLVSFSAGVFLVTAGALALEVFHLADSYWQGVGLIVLGYALASAVQILLPETHHHHDVECASRHGAAAQKLIIGDAIHNVADGVVLVVAFSVSSVVGVAAMVSIVIHEVLQEISEFFVMRRAGFSVIKALTVNFAVSSTILIGVALGYLALASEGLEVALLALSAGFFVHVVIHDLLPKHGDHENMKTFLLHALVVMVGVLLMGLVASAVSEGHEHSEVESEHEELGGYVE